MYVEAKYFVFESYVPNIVKSFEDVTKDYVCAVFILLSVGYGFMGDDEGSVRPSTSPETVLVVTVGSCSVRWFRRVSSILSRILPCISRRKMGV